MTEARVFCRMFGFSKLFLAAFLNCCAIFKSKALVFIFLKLVKKTKVKYCKKIGTTEFDIYCFVNNWSNARSKLTKNESLA